MAITCKTCGRAIRVSAFIEHVAKCDAGRHVAVADIRSLLGPTGPRRIESASDPAHYRWTTSSRP
jgi:hypothetical protein